jgi:hypothetical protein
MLQREIFGVQVLESPLTSQLYLVKCHSESITEMHKRVRPELTVWVVSENIRPVSWEILFLLKSTESDIQEGVSELKVLVQNEVKQGAYEAG